MIWTDREWGEIWVVVLCDLYMSNVKMQIVRKLLTDDPVQMVNHKFVMTCVLKSGLQSPSVPDCTQHLRSTSRHEVLSGTDTGHWAGNWNWKPNVGTISRQVKDLSRLGWGSNWTDTRGDITSVTSELENTIFKLHSRSWWAIYTSACYIFIIFEENDLK